MFCDRPKVEIENVKCVHAGISWAWQVVSIINPRRSCAGGLRYLSCMSVGLSVCLSVCYHLIVDIVHFYGLPKVRAVLL